MVCLATTSGVALARQLELDFPGLAHRVKVFLPEGHEVGKSYPTLFYYHGAGGEPSTARMRLYTRDRDWIIVGMSYYQAGAVTFNIDSLGKQKHLLGSVKNYLKTKYGTDPRRCYVAGFSKGGWLSDMLLQLDPDIAGAVILGAGHLDQVKKSPKRYRKEKGKGKPVFVGIGRMDPNYPFALQAVTFHRGLGATTTFEVWPEIGHTLPEDGSHALYQWLALRAKSVDELRSTAKKEMNLALGDALELEPLAQWDRLRQLRNLPFASLLGKGWIGKIDAKIATLEQSGKILKEKEALAAHRKLIRQEIKKNTVDNIVQVHAAYQALAEKYSGTRQGKLARHDYERTAARINHFSKQKKSTVRTAGNGGEKKEPAAEKPKKIDLPTNRRRIPKNPLIR